MKPGLTRNGGAGLLPDAAALADSAARQRTVAQTATTAKITPQDMNS
jgi:hypothetical protein